MSLSQFIVGILMILSGIALLFFPLFTGETSLFVAWIYGIPFLVIGLVILLNKKEDVIEKIKRKK